MTFLFTLSLSALAAGGKAPKPDFKRDIINYQVKFTPVKQEKKYWCWAATVKMLLSTTDSPLKNLSQCEIVSRVNKIDCCNPRGAEGIMCNQPSYEKSALGILGVGSVQHGRGHYQSSLWQEGIDTGRWFNYVKSQLKAGKLVGIGHFNNAGSMDYSGHIQVAFGLFTDANGKEHLAMFDPYTGGYHYWSQEWIISSTAWASDIVLD